MDENYTFPTPAIRETVIDTSYAQFTDLDEDANTFGVQLHLDYVGGQTSLADPIIDMACADGYTIVDGEYAPSAEYPPDSSYSGEMYPGHLALYFEPDNTVSNTPTLSTGDAVDQLGEIADSFKEKDDGELQILFSVDDDVEQFALSELFDVLHKSPLSVRDVRASETGFHGPTVTVSVTRGKTSRNPDHMAGINKREDIMLNRHEALTLVDALEQYEGDRRIDRLKGKLIDEYKLRRYLRHLDE